MLRVRPRNDFSKRWFGHDDCTDYAPLIAWFQAGEEGTSTLHPRPDSKYSMLPSTTNETGFEVVLPDFMPIMLSLI